MANIVLVTNIIASYIVWILFTKMLYARIKNKLIYVAFVSTLYSTIPVYYAIVYGIALALLPVLLTFVLVVALRRKSFLQVALIPLPIILVSTYLLLV
jgi:hypothetical protein